MVAETGQLQSNALPAPLTAAHRRRQSRREEEDSLSSLEQRRKEQKRAAKEALGEFEKAIECCPLEAIRARETLENARERAMEMVYSSGGNNADDDDGEKEEKEVDVDKI